MLLVLMLVVVIMSKPIPEAGKKDNSSNTLEKGNYNDYMKTFAVTEESHHSDAKSDDERTFWDYVRDYAIETINASPVAFSYVLFMMLGNLLTFLYRRTIKEAVMKCLGKMGIVTNKDEKREDAEPCNAKCSCADSRDKKKEKRAGAGCDQGCKHLTNADQKNCEASSAGKNCKFCKKKDGCDKTEKPKERETEGEQFQTAQTSRVSSIVQSTQGEPSENTSRSTSEEENLNTIMTDDLSV